MKRSDQYKLFTEYFGDYYTREKADPDKHTKQHNKKVTSLKSARLHPPNKAR